MRKNHNDKAAKWIDSAFCERCQRRWDGYGSGKNVAEMPMYEIAELVGSVFQNPKTQFFHTNSNAEMAFGLENSGVEPEYIRERIKNTITELNIEKLADRNVFSMSGRGETASCLCVCICHESADLTCLMSHRQIWIWQESNG